MRKIVTSLILIILLLNTYTIVKAADGISLSGPSQANIGETVTITLTSSGLTGNVTLSASNATLSTSQIWVENNSVTFSATITASFKPSAVV